ncbi:methenyltetrahydrofolate cyclohydrolase [Nannochloropsis gaditana]|uniref:Methenyltetrahydrofolate cyclohydrolase n=2 Tax=Nannochloropsis gaditana TaxID=72520 RepID=W7TQS1_9STRA|nr:methenyltetrahydrofolate cyclohydrolase [Nannochloropsis gaditana]
MPRGLPVASAMTAIQRVLGRSVLARTVALPHDRRLSIPVLRRKGSIMGYVFPESSEEIYPPGNGPRILDGRMLSRRIRAGIKAQVKIFKEEHGYVPHLAIITVGERPPEEAER